MHFDREAVIREYAMWADTATAVRRDLDRVAAGQILGYSLDYSVLFPYLWRGSPIARDRPKHTMWDAVCRSVCIELLRYERPARTRFVFTSVSFIEAMEHVNRHVQLQATLRDGDGLDEYFEQLRREVNDMEQALRAAVADDLMTRRQLEDKLERISRKSGLGAPHALNRLRMFIAPGGPLVGIRDVVPSSLRIGRYVERFTQLYEEMERTRGHLPTETRTPDERRFHYRVDCANIVLCEAVSHADSNMEMGFVTKASNKKQLVREHGRTSLMLLLMLRLNRLTEFRDLQERQEFLECMHDDAMRVMHLLERRDSIDERRDRYLGGRMSNFEDLYKKLLFVNRDENDGVADSRVADLKSATSSKDQFRDTLTASIDSTTASLRKMVEDHSGLLDDELLTTFQIDSEPRARQILNR